MAYYAGIEISYIYREGFEDLDHEITENFEDSSSIKVDEWVRQQVWDLMTVWEGEWSVVTETLRGEMSQQLITGVVELDEDQFTRMKSIKFVAQAGE